MLLTNRPRKVTMHTLPTAMIQLLAPFAPLFSKRLWPHVQVLLAGTILAPGKRTVSAALRAVGLGSARRFERYHRVLNRAEWSSREASRVLLKLLVRTFLADQSEPLVIGVDETLERRRGARRSRPKAFTGIRCAPATATSSRRAL